MRCFLQIVTTQHSQPRRKNWMPLSVWASSARHSGQIGSAGKGSVARVAPWLASAIYQDESHAGWATASVRLAKAFLEMPVDVARLLRMSELAS